MVYSCGYEQMIIDLAEQKANYLGLQSFRTRNFSRAGVQGAASFLCPRLTFFIRVREARECQQGVTFHSTFQFSKPLPRSRYQRRRVPICTDISGDPR